ncbi:MAG: ribosome silencing factor, partial [Phycisphaerae bacterium]|nr:ribosome silencing factor [Phycisphaerae bacterium]
MNSQSTISTQDLAVSLAAMASQTRCRDVVVLDMRGRSPVTDFFVLATGTSDRQMRTVGDELADHGAQCGFKVFRRSGDETAHWILLDFVGVVAHIFNESSRAFYDLEALWDGCPRVNWQLLAESRNPVAATIDTRPTTAPIPTASVGATTDTAVSTGPALPD